MKKSEIRSMFNMCTVSTIESKVLFVFRINQYHATGIFLYPLKILENLCNVFMVEERNQWHELGRFVRFFQRNCKVYPINLLIIYYCHK